MGATWTMTSTERAASDVRSSGKIDLAAVSPDGQFVDRYIALSVSSALSSPASTMSMSRRAA